MTTPISTAKGIPAHEYRAHLESVLRVEQARHARRRRIARLVAAVLLFAALILTAALTRLET
jgi:hypothetical protein